MWNAEVTSRNFSTPMATSVAGVNRLLSMVTLLRTSSGKLRRAASLQQYRTGDLAPPRKVHGGLLARQMLRSAVGFLLARFRT